jgi:hypothetical protein
MVHGSKGHLDGLPETESPIDFSQGFGRLGNYLASRNRVEQEANHE